MTAATIAALASGRPPAAIAVLRLSGPQALGAVAALTGRPVPAPRRLSRRWLRDPASGARLDDALVVVFPGPASATGEDMAELHLHGGPAVVADVLTALLALPGLRLAEPGEFSRRAFGNGRVDLAEVEGLADLIAAETSAQRQQALALAGGVLSQAAEAWRDRCLDILAEAEAALDFAEEEADVAAGLAATARGPLAALADELDLVLADAGRGARLRDGVTIVVSGPPNVGKSSLVNALARRDVAIVTAVPGTTRDAIEVPLDLGGVAAVLIDTAGLRDTEDPVEAEGIRRARARAAAADLVLDVSAPDVAASGDTSGNAVRWQVLNKVDLATTPPPAGAHPVSALHGDGIAALRAALADWAATLARPAEPALLSHARHRQAFERAAAALREASATTAAEVQAEGLRLAIHAFDSIAGRVGVEAVLDRIFSRFCIGK